MDDSWDLNGLDRPSAAQGPVRLPIAAFHPAKRSGAFHKRRRKGPGIGPGTLRTKNSKNASQKIPEDHEDQFVWVVFWYCGTQSRKEHIAYFSVGAASFFSIASSDLTWLAVSQSRWKCGFAHDKKNDQRVRTRKVELCTHPNPSYCACMSSDPVSELKSLRESVDSATRRLAHDDWSKEHSFQAAYVGVSTNIGRAAKPCVKQTD